MANSYNSSELFTKLTIISESPRVHNLDPEKNVCVQYGITHDLFQTQLHYLDAVVINPETRETRYFKAIQDLDTIITPWYEVLPENKPQGK